ncbi:MAG: lytic murein transglycosylase [Novosphingobium sp.]
MPIPARTRPVLLAALVAALLSSPPLPARAQSAGEAGFAGYLQTLSVRARREGVSEATIARMTAGLTLNPRVVALDRAQPGGASGGSAAPPFAPYRRQHVDADRIDAGRRMYGAVAGMLPGIEARYGVPGPILLAIWGHETHYGSYTGDFDLARSLTTLAYEGRRRELFAGEFIALLKMVDRGVSPSLLKGSWAGAFGNPQFLPSVYLRLAADGDGNGTRDIWNSRADTLASIANYFRDAGWRRGDPWGVPALVPAGFNWAAVRSRLVAPSCPAVHARHSAWRTAGEWRSLGVTPLAPIRSGTLATLLQPDGPGTPAWLLTGNYQVILKYNCSNYYGLSVGLLADAIDR